MKHLCSLSMRFEFISIVHRVYDDIPTHRIERLKGQEKRQVGKSNIDFNLSRRMRFFLRTSLHIIIHDK
jgi:hypothetical protein